MIKKKGNSFVLLGVCVLLPLLLLTLPVTIPNNLNTYIQVHPYQKWILEKGNESELISTVINYNSFTENFYKTIKFERGEQVSLEYYKGLKGKNKININDTVAVIASSELDNILNSLQNQANVLKAELVCSLTGEKESLIKEATREYDYAVAKIKESDVRLKRSKQLFEKGYIAAEEYETTVWENKLNSIESEKYLAKLEAVKGGSKQSQIDYLQTQIQSLESQIEKYSQLKNKLTILSPISGNLISGTSSDTILTVIDLDKLVLTFPVEFRLLQHFVTGKIIQINLGDLEIEVTGKIISRSSEVHFLDGKQVVTVNALIDNPGAALLPGLILQGDIHLNNMTIKDFIADNI